MSIIWLTLKTIDAYSKLLTINHLIKQLFMINLL